MKYHGSILVEWVGSIPAFGGGQKIEWNGSVPAFGWRDGIRET